MDERNNSDRIKEYKELIEKLESDRIERTISLTDTDKYCEAICAFANDLPNHNKPGYLFIGLENNGTVKKLDMADKFLAGLGDLRSNGNIQPIPFLVIEKIDFPDGSIVAIKVQPSDIPPVRYKGRVYIRIGPRKGIASEQEERLLSEKRISAAKTFDSRPNRESALTDLSISSFTNEYRSNAFAKEVIEENHRTIELQLASLRFYDLKINCPTNAGILLFGKNPTYFFSGAYIQFIKWKSQDMSGAILNEKEIRGDLLTVLNQLISLLEINITQSINEKNILQEKNVFDYPVAALREYLMNAVMHRDYESNAPIRFYWFSDHIEIQSPGGLFGSVSQENFPEQNDYRNPVISEAMKIYGFVNKYGRGIYRAQSALKENGNPAPEYEFKQNYFLVKIKSK